MTAAPLLLLFDTDAATIAEKFGSLERNADVRSFKTGIDVKRTKGTILYEGVSLTFQIVTDVPKRSDYQSLFTNFRVEESCCAMELGLDGHVAGGQRISPIVRSLLAAGSKIAKQMSTCSVLWKPAGLLSDVDFYVQSVDSYSAGGVFPVLSLVKFDLDEKETCLTSSGLSWFSGQEVLLRCREVMLDRAELTKRAVRLVHDIAVNGPVLSQQSIDDLDSNNKIILSINQSATVVTAEIVPKTSAQ